MPIYDYKCESCGEIYSIYHGFHQVDPVACPKCEIEMVKQIAPTPAIFKGTGWAGKKHG